MNPFYEVTFEDINKLNAISLCTLMLKLIYLEASAYNIPKSCVSGSLNITARDGGQDGSISWIGGVENTDMFPTRNCMFQNKATAFGPQECYNELFKDISKSNELRPMLLEVANGRQHYVIFNNKSLDEQDIKKRKDKIIEGYNHAGYSGVLETNISIYGSVQIAEWTNVYYASIIFVKEFLGQAVSSNFQMWERWSNYPEYNRLQYEQDEERSKVIYDIKNLLTEPQKVARLIGLSGLGKSRMILEMFRPPENGITDYEQTNLNNLVVYLDCSQINDPTSIIKDVSMLIDLRRKGILVFDNCNTRLHYLLEQEVTHLDSKLSMISIDNDPAEKNDNAIYIKRLPDNTIEKIVVREFPNLATNQSTVRKIVELSNGFPKIAALLSKSYLDREPNVGSLTKDELVEKLIDCKLNLTTDECKTLCSLSVFDHVGYKGELESQLQFIAKEIADLEVSKVNSHMMRFHKRDIIDFHGKYLQVVPRPLAIRLAEEWWKDCLPSKAKDLFIDENIPIDMLRSLCKQFRYLDYVDNVREIAKNLCGEQAPFGQAEVLYTERGSMVFRYLVEVNPQTTADSIYRVISRTDLAELKLIKGRRDLVIALEMLCYWNEQFYKAASALMLLSLSENEPYANNATGQFIQLFHIHLSGANASFNERLVIINELISRGDTDSIRLAVKALSNVIYYGFLSKSGGSELQGTKQELKEWEPKNWGEIFNYMRHGLSLLLTIIDHYPENEEMIKEAFEKALYGLLQLGLLEDVKQFIGIIQSKTNSIWEKLLQELIRFEKDEQIKNEPLRKKCVTDCIEILSPKTIEEQIIFIICKPPYDNEKEENGRYIDISELKAKKLATELISNKEIYNHLELFLKGEQRYGIMVGLLLGENTENREELFYKMISQFKLLNPKESNPTVISGLLEYIKQSDKKQYLELLQSLFSDEIMNRYLFDIIRIQNLDIDDLSFVEKLIENKVVKPEQYKLLSYGSVLNNFSPEDIQRFINKVIENSPDFIYPSIEILGMYLFYDEEDNKLNYLNRFIQELLIQTSLLDYIKRDSMELYHREELLKKVLKLKEINPDLLSSIFNDVKDVSKDFWGSYRIHSDIRSLVFNLIENNYEESWETLSNMLLDNPKEYNGLINLLNPKNEIHSQNGIDSVISENVLIEWCKKEKKAYEILPSLISVLQLKGDDVLFNKLIYKLFDLKLYDQITLGYIFSNMMPRSWIGSTVPIYQGHIKALKTLGRYDDPLIVRWVEECIADLNKRIEYEKERDSEEHFRY